jgi:branched-chain amino acid transport system substrate-binding protein
MKRFLVLARESQAILMLPLLVVIFFLCPRLSAAEPFKVGAILNLTGYGARWGESAQRGIILAQEELNAAGGVAGQPITVVFEDARSGDLSSCAVAAQKLVSVDKVQAILTQWSAETDVVWPIAMRAGIPVISTSAGAPNFVRGRSLLIRTWGDDSALIRRIVQLLSKRGLQRPIALIAPDPYFTGLAQELRRALADVGISLAGEIELSMNEVDLRGAALKAKAMRPDAVVSLLPYAPQAAFLKGISSLGVKATAVFGILGSDDASFLGLAGSAAEGLIIPTYGRGSDSFTSRFHERWNQEPWLSADTSYDTLHLLAQAAQRGARGAALFEKIVSTSDFQGASGTITISPGGERAERMTDFLVVAQGRAVPLIEEDARIGWER